MPRSKKGPETPRFEVALDRLEAIVTELEGGELSLDDSLRLFEEGVRLTRLCSARLEEAQRRIEVLVRDERGGLGTAPFASAGTDDDSEPDDAPPDRLPDPRDDE